MPVYFDNNATTVLDSRVFEAMQPFLLGPYGNPSSVHRYGRAARDAIEAARARVADLAGAQVSEVTWTSGATESNNFALKGFADAFGAQRANARMLYAATEHPAVMEAAESLRNRGWTVETIAVARDGSIDWPKFEAQLAVAPVQLVAVMAANNETGVIQDLARVSKRVHAAGALLLVDAVQAAGKIALPECWREADLMSLSAHKIFGPKGVGVLLVKSHVELVPLLHGGGQERGVRGGTENVAGIVGFGAAAELAHAEWSQRAAHTLALRQQLEAGVRAIDGSIIFGDGAPRLPNTVQFAIPDWEGEALLMALDRTGIAVSSGSACASGTGEPSHVLLAMGFSRAVAFGAIRVSFGPQNTAAEVDRLLQALHSLRVERRPA
jgi:cysteine desulfurase